MLDNNVKLRSNKLHVLSTQVNTRASFPRTVTKVKKHQKGKTAANKMHNKEASVEKHSHIVPSNTVTQSVVVVVIFIELV